MTFEEIEKAIRADEDLSRVKIHHDDRIRHTRAEISLPHQEARIMVYFDSYEAEVCMECTYGHDAYDEHHLFHTDSIPDIITFIKLMLKG